MMCLTTDPVTVKCEESSDKLPVVAVIIPTCLAAEGSRVGLNAILNALNESPISHETIIVLNDPKRFPIAEVLWFVDEHPIFVCVPRRLGYVGACNLGYAAAGQLAPRAAYVCVLNDDVLAQGEFLAPMVDALDADPKLGIVGPSVHHVGRDGLWGKGDEKYKYVEGWCFMARQTAVWEAAACDGGVLFDPEFSPGYCEDMDLAISMQQICSSPSWNWTIGQVDLPLTHLRSVTFGDNREPFWSRNRRRLVIKWGLNRDGET